VQTLLIASVASAASSFTCSKIWGPGTLFSAAASPIIVALVAELVRRPVGQVSSTAQRVSPLRYRPPTPGARRPGAPPLPEPPAIDRPRYPPTPDPAFLPPAGTAFPPAPGGVDPPAGQAPAAAEWAQGDVEPAAGARIGPRWRLVLATGLLACVIVVALFTTLDILAGHSITGSGDSTTYFSGHTSPAPTKPTVPATSVTGSTGTTGTAGASSATTPTATTTTPAAVAPAAAGVTGATGATTTGTSGATGPVSAPQSAADAPALP
jgi:hypothetical protein